MSKGLITVVVNLHFSKLQMWSGFKKIFTEDKFL